MESPPKTVLEGFSLVSLFPRTFNNHRDLDPDPNRRYNGPLEASGALLEARALKNPNRLLEQAKSILDDRLESLNVHNLDNVRAGDTVGDLQVGNHKNRRPDLGRKRAHFSMKQNSSQSVESLIPFVDMDKLPDPEEFFLAFEKHENAKKELSRQTGKALMDLDQNVPHIAERRRRPGLLRKSASYKHRFSMAPSGDKRTFLPSQETQSQDLCSPTPSNHPLQPEHTGQEKAGEERPADTSDKAQSSEDEDDESDEIIGMLQKRFKPIELNKSCLPELSSALQSEFRTLGESLQESQDKRPDLHDIVSTIGKETTLGCYNLEKRSDHPSTSPKRPKSPYSSISLLKARLFQTRRGKDPLSALDFGKADSCTDTFGLATTDVQKSVKGNVEIQNISAVTGMDIESGYPTGDSDTRETNLNSPVHESDSIVNRDTQKHGDAEFTFSEKNKGDSMMSDIPKDSIDHMELDDDIVEHGHTDVNPSLHHHDKEIDSTPAKDILKTFLSSDDVMHIELDHAIRSNQTPKSAEHETESNVVHTKDMPEFDHNIMAHNTTGEVLKDYPNEVSDPAAIFADACIEPDNGEVEEDIEGGYMENLNCNKEQSTGNAVENLGKNRRSSDHDILSSAGENDDLDHDRPSSSRARPLKKTQKASSKAAKHNRSKTREQPAHDHPPAATKETREFKEFSQRKSLAACGTQWEAGLRRSTRIRTRPLEYWNGERPLYGRIHDSLITVVGIKFFSPGKDSFHVKSYVSDEYKEMVEQAALH